jgi:hypothetical protein
MATRHDNAPQGYLNGRVGRENGKLRIQSSSEAVLKFTEITVESRSSWTLRSSDLQVLGGAEYSLPYSVFKWDKSRLRARSCQESA